MKEKFYRFMAGRYGTDNLNRFILAVFAVLLLANIFIKGTAHTFIMIICIALLVICYVRMLSKNINKRYSENEKYLHFKRQLFTKLKNVKERFVQRKDYKFFTCPNCKATLRVPKGRGKIKIVCRRCGNSFLGKS